MLTIEGARQDLVAAVADFTWTLGDSAEASLHALVGKTASRDLADPAGLSPTQEHGLLVAMGHEANADLARNAVFNRAQAVVDRPSQDPMTEAIATEKAFAVIYRAIAKQGATARLTDADRGELADHFSSDMIGFIEREIAFNAKRESHASWHSAPRVPISNRRCGRSASSLPMPMSARFAANISCCRRSSRKAGATIPSLAPR